jgi:RHS repeat-associated protein
LKLRFPEPWKGALASSTTDYEQYGYDANGNRTSFRNRAGETIGFSFDALNRMTCKDLPEEPDVTYGYDLLGRLKSAMQPGNNLTFTYDALSRKLTETGPHGTVTSQYDIGGRRTKLTYPDGFVADYTYLVTGEMKEIRQPTLLLFGTPPPPLATFGYDDLGRRSSITRVNGATTSYSYDPVSRLSQLSHDPAGTANDLTLSFSYNPASQITSNTRSNDVYAWTGHGNGTLSSPANGLNQLTSHNGGAVTHDAKGNVTYDPTTGYTHGYSSENLLRSVSGSGWAGTLTYDPLMRLYDAGAGGRTRFVYDGEDRIAEYSSNGSQVARFVQGPGVDEPLIEYTGSGLGTRRFTHADERGTIIAVSDDAGNVTKVGRFDEHGRIQSFASYRFGYTGKPYETLTELYYSRARMYNERFGGRFMQVDPIGYADGPNPYAYVSGDPVNRRDPTGKCGYRYEDGTCQVKVDPKTGAAGIAAGKTLEARLNKYDAAVKATNPKATIAVRDAKGNQIGSMTGKQVQRTWNGQKFQIKSSDSAGRGNQGLGATTPGLTTLSVGAVSQYEVAAMGRGRSIDSGRDTLIFHELGHALPFGWEINRANQGSPGNPNTIGEIAANNAGRAAADAVGGTLQCDLTGYC